MIKIKHHFFYSFVFLFSCSSGGGSSNSIPQQPEIIINNSSLPEIIFSFQRINLEISSNYPSCNYSLNDSDIHWITSSGNSFAFNAPVTTLEEEDFKFVISSISSGNCPSGTKEINLKVKNFNQNLILKMKDIKFKVISNELISITYEKNSLNFGEIIKYLGQNDIKILDIITEDGDLEDVFVQLTNK